MKIKKTGYKIKLLGTLKMKIKMQSIFEQRLITQGVYLKSDAKGKLSGSLRY